MRLKKKLEEQFGVQITEEKLRAAIELRNKMHQTMLRFYDLSLLDSPVVTGRETMLVSDYLKFTFDYEKSMALVEELTKKLKENYLEGERRVSPDAVRILITGCPMGKSLEKVADAIESPDAGGVVVGFENCGNLKCSSIAVDESKDPISALSEKYLNIPCSVMSPNHGRIALIKEYVQKYRAAGVADVILQACHTYSVESRAIKEALKKENVGYISIETDYSQGDSGQLSTRFGAFTEML